MPISFSNAALGTTVEVPSIDGGKSKIKIPSGTQHGKQFRLKGKGMPVLRRNIFGDLYIRVVTQVPASLSKRQKELLEEFNDIESNKPDPVIKAFLKKPKNFGKSHKLNGNSSDYVRNFFNCSFSASLTCFFSYQ